MLPGLLLFVLKFVSPDKERVKWASVVSSNLNLAAARVRLGSNDVKYLAECFNSADSMCLWRGTSTGRKTLASASAWLEANA